MNKFETNKIFDNGSEKSKIGSIKIENIQLDEKLIEDFLVKYILNDETLKYIFCNDSPSEFILKRMYKRFTPSDDVNVEDYVAERMKKSSFYSFFAEGVLPLIYRDLYDYNLEWAAIDINQTDIGTQNGIDVCLTDRANSLFAMGEAKFYRDFDDGMQTVVNNFIKDKSFLNKLESLFKHIDNVENLQPLIIKQLGKDECEKITMKDFLNCKLDFCGFVLHELGEHTIDDFNDVSIYSKYVMLPSDIIEQIKKKYPEFESENLSIKLFHLFVSSKRELIIKAINEAKKHV